MPSDLEYVGRDLEAMSFAVNYHRWILEIFEPYLGDNVVEVGAGTGSFSELLSQRTLKSLSLVEPSDAMRSQLQLRMSRLSLPFPVSIYEDIFRTIGQEVCTKDDVDSIVYVNVLEHIEDDESELRAINQALPQGGCLFVFVPALSWLLSSFDLQIGHFRRYSRQEIERKCREAGFKIILSRYFDSLGVIPWWIRYRLLRSHKFEAGAIRFYDEKVVPIARLLESRFEPPLGKNVILIAQKL